MTSPNDDYWFRRLDEKLDRVLTTVGEHSTEIAMLKVKHSDLEDDFSEYRKSQGDAKTTSTSWRQVATTIALSSIVALFVGFVPAMFHLGG
jgi:hypothetical protein